jgi:hypothetical protein
MFNDIVDGTIDYEKEYFEIIEVLKEAKEIIIEERKHRYSLEQLYNETFNQARECFKTLKKYRDQISKEDWEELKKKTGDLGDEEDD